MPLPPDTRSQRKYSICRVGKETQSNKKHKNHTKTKTIYTIDLVYSAYVKG